jgi:hypothetical protein
MNDRIFVRLRILSAVNTPEEITRLIGLESERSWHVGDKRGKTQIVEPSNGWLITSGIGETASLEEHVQALSDRIAPVSARIAALAEDATIEVSCAIYAEHPPALSFAASCLQRLADIKAGLDIDLYITGDDNA